ncbi:pseudouridine synthase [Pandoraea anhela]|uniref:Dual-specificity RNA pseudouridine synthase RluF n=1 Tax=Pandoraea anhela TaxID=2508295 RepID=A0A5E4VUM6_9BURK|nr:pseudouridine synthase [Pandoraea anhela]VVE16207.1 23S rRNA pseudouridine(2604) synthase [Pandoraea anhela]
MSDTPRAKLSAKHPRTLDKTRAPVRSAGALRRPTKAVPASMLDASGAKKKPVGKPARPRPVNDAAAQTGARRPAGSGTPPRRPASDTPYEKRATGERPPARGQRERVAGARPARFDEDRPRRNSEGGARGDFARPVKRDVDNRAPRRFDEDRPRRNSEGGARGDFARPVKRDVDNRAPRSFDEDRPRRNSEPAPRGRFARDDRDNHAPRSTRPTRAPRVERDDEDDDIKIHHDAAGSLRLSKRMSELGLCSRREADEWIAKGWVRVDGRVVKELGTKILPTQEITVVQAAQKEQANRVTILLHKPVGYVSGQAEDGYDPAVVLVTSEHHWSEDDAGVRFSPAHLRSLAPAGRLDIDSTGLLVLTQDGRIAKQLIGEDSDIEKEYLVRVSYNEHSQNVEAHFPAERLALLRHGLELDDQPLKPAQVDWQNPEQLRFVLKEGKKRQIRRMCELVGLHVTGLKRVRMGRITLGNLPVGEWRYLRAGEGF